MKTSATGRALIEACEGLRLTAYQDSVGVWTIGYGHTSAAGAPVVKAGLTLSGRAEADAILARDLAAVERDVSKYVTCELTQNQFDALVSFTFNLGAGNLSKSTLRKKLNAGDVAGASAEFGRWNKAGGKVLAGLTKRRKAERLLFEGSPDAALYLLGAHPPPPDVEPVEKPKPKPSATETGIAAAVAAGGAATAAQSGLPWWGIALIVIGIGAAAYFVIRHLKKG